MKIFNTLGREKQDFKPLSSREVKVYYCGPTVYNYAHIGNLKTFVVEDAVIKTLKFLGYNVKTTMNITDIDDKTIRDSMAVGEDLMTFTKKYTDIFLEDIVKLKIQPADSIVPISEVLPEMIRMINTLLRRGYAYMSDDGSICTMLGYRAAVEQLSPNLYLSSICVYLVSKYREIAQPH